MLISIPLLVAMAVGTALVGAYLWIRPGKPHAKSAAKQVGMDDAKHRS